MERPPGVDQALGEREGLGRGQQQVVRDAALRLCVMGLCVMGLRVMGLRVTGLRVTGLCVTGLCVTGEGTPQRIARPGVARAASGIPVPAWVAWSARCHRSGSGSASQPTSSVLKRSGCSSCGK